MKNKHANHDFKGLTGFVEIFRGGQQTDSQGRKHNFTDADLDSIIANHDAKQPPLHVITHREMFSPFSYGDVAELKRKGNVLFARSENVEPQFEALVKNRRLPNRSIRIKRADSGFKLDHVAWLGSEPPAVEGLAPVEFKAPIDDEFDFMNGDDSVDTYTPKFLGRMIRKFREYLIDQKGLEEADKVIPEYEIESITTHANNLSKNNDRAFSSKLEMATYIDSNDESQERQNSSPENHNSSATDFTGNTRTERGNGQAEEADSGGNNNKRKGVSEVKEFTQKDIDAAVSKAKTESDAALTAERRKVNEAKFNAEIKAQIDTGNLTPALAVGMCDFMLQLNDDEGTQFEFSAGEGDKAETLKTTQRKWFRDFMAKLGKQVDMSESAAEDSETRTAVDFNAPSGSHIDQDRLETHNKALDYMASHDGVEYVAAVQAVEKQEQ